MVLSSRPIKDIARVECRLSAGVAAHPRTKPTDLGCESAENWQLPWATSTIAIVIITQPVSWYSFERPTEGGRPSTNV